MLCSKNYRFALLLIFNLAGLSAFAAKVDSLEVPSASMNKSYKAAVVLPDSYVNSKNKAAYPVLYLLHGASGHFRNWLTSTPDKMLVKNLADQYNLIIVMPEGEVYGWYLDSPVNPESKFETHIINEVIPKVDATYRTIANKNGRVISGLSMGGHGAMYLSIRHPELFCAAGTMSGAMDMNWSKFRISESYYQSLRDRFQKLLGTPDPNSEIVAKHSVVNMVEAIKKNGLAIVIDCGVDDFLIDVNRELHQRLLYNQVPHDYIERPGEHTWEYWQNSLPYHVLFFYNVLKKNGSTVN
ncbi:alpha/beta hydrolase [Haliscomenobacter sp.]|uniref:alpha/beta hydrolase n=1 Tax=Haliscomenobacter sp. TaxID=2717303 RepID=UPI003BAAC66C